LGIGRDVPPKTGGEKMVVENGSQVNLRFDEINKCWIVETREVGDSKWFVRGHFTEHPAAWEVYRRMCRGNKIPIPDCDGTEDYEGRD